MWFIFKTNRRLLYNIFHLKTIASKVVKLCKDLGVLITPAGSTFPKNYDPNDSVIRLAPTYVSKEELADAMNVFTTSVEVAHFEIEV